MVEKDGLDSTASTLTSDARQPVRWKRDNLESWRAALPPQRREDDQRKLTDLFNLAAEVPILKDALEWAREHDIEFIIDKTTTAGAYYYVGSGVVALGVQCLNWPGTAVSYLVHEIRHAWQDYHHMIPTGGKFFAGYFMRQALIEADATAHQDVANFQYDIAMHIRRARLFASKGTDQIVTEAAIKLAAYEKKLADSTRDASAYWNNFSKWFKSWKPRRYGGASILRFAWKLGVPGVEPLNSKYEYNPYENGDVPTEEGIDVTRMGDLRRLGKTFSNINYFNADKDKSLTLQFTASSTAQRFYTERKGTKLVEEVRRRWLLLKLQKGHDVVINAYC